jgi:hypothetical protein
VLTNEKRIWRDEVKVIDLIRELSALDPDSEVILQKDAEGNGYSPLSEVDGAAVYVPDSTWSGNVYSTEWSAEDASMDDDEWIDMLKKPRCVVLAPVN